jgi:hypothetical protein
MAAAHANRGRRVLCAVAHRLIEISRPCHCFRSLPYSDKLRILASVTISVIGSLGEVSKPSAR